MGGELGIPPKDRALEGVLWYIQSHHLEGGDRLPAERELCERVGVSRTALRDAMAQLVSTHVIEGRQGSGNYVCPPRPINIFQDTYNFSSAARAVGLTPGSLLVHAKVGTVDSSLAGEIELPVGSSLFEMQRVRLVNNVPSSIETAFVNRESCPGVEAHDFERESLYDVLRDEYGVTVKHGIERITITRVNTEESQLLDVEEGTPALFERALEKDENLVPVEYVKSVILPGRYRFASSGTEIGTHVEVGDEWLRS